MMEATDPRRRRAEYLAAARLQVLPVPAVQEPLQLFGNNGSGGRVVPHPTIMSGKVNLGALNLPPGTVDPITFDEIADGTQIVRILKSPNTYTYIGLTEWEAWVKACREQGRPVVNPETNLPVGPADVDIFTAQITPTVGGARRRRATRRRSTRRRSTRRCATRRRSTRRRN